MCTGGVYEGVTSVVYKIQIPKILDVVDITPCIEIFKTELSSK